MPTTVLLQSYCYDGRNKLGQNKNVRFEKRCWKFASDIPDLRLQLKRLFIPQCINYNLQGENMCYLECTIITDLSISCCTYSCIFFHRIGLTSCSVGCVYFFSDFVGNCRGSSASTRKSESIPDAHLQLFHLCIRDGTFTW